MRYRHSWSSWQSGPIGVELPCKAPSTTVPRRNYAVFGGFFLGGGMGGRVGKVVC